MKLHHPVLCLAALALFASCLPAKPATATSPGTENAVQPVPGWQAPTPGEHPRLLFRKSELPALRARAETPEGRAILARLRELLGNNGESSPTVFNPHVPRNIGPQGQGELPIGAFTFTHPVTRAIALGIFEPCR